MQSLAWPGDRTSLGPCPVQGIGALLKILLLLQLEGMGREEGEGGELCPEMFPQLSKAQLEIVMAEL